MMTGFGGLGGLGSMYGLGGLLMLGMGLIPILLIGLVVWGVIEATRRRGDQGAMTQPGRWTQAAAPTAAPPTVAQSTSQSPLAILEERYARSEIDRDDYLARRRDLLQ